MKIGISVQTPEVEPILPLALLTGSFEAKCQKAAEYGANGLELITVDPIRLNAKEISDTLARYNLIPCAISSGAIASTLGFTLMNDDDALAQKAQHKLKELLDFAAAVGAPLVTVGSFRGRSFGESKKVQTGFVKLLHKAGQYAEDKKVRIAIEPLNRYECNFINNTLEGLDLLKVIAHPSIGLLIDTFHANIEESSRTQAFIEAQSAQKLFHVHIADNNRMAPGLGLIDFGQIVRTLNEIGYKGFISAELLPKPTPDKAARLTIEHILHYLKTQN